MLNHKSFRSWAAKLLVLVAVLSLFLVFLDDQEVQALPVWDNVATRSTTQEPVRNAAVAGEGVYLHNGEMRYDLDLISIPGRHTPLSVSLTYRSQLAYDGPIGYGWSASFLSRMTYDSANDEITWYTSTGRIDTFTNSGTAGSGPYTLTGYHLHLERDDNSTSGDATDDLFTVHGQNHGTVTAMTYSYTNDDGNGDEIYRCESYQSRVGDPVTITYDGNGKVDEIRGDLYDSGVSTTDYVLSFTYDTDNRLEMISDYANYSAQSAVVGSSFTGNREWVFKYDSNGDLEEIKLPKTERYYSDTKGTTYRTRIRFDYDANHNLTEVFDARQNNESTPIGWLYVSYDGSDRVEYQDIGRSSTGDTSKRHHFLYTSSTVTDVINAENYRSEYFLNGDDTLDKVRNHTGEWNTSLVQTVTKLRSADPGYFETDYNYDAELHVNEIVYPEGNSVEYLYDTSNSDVRSRGNLLRVLQRPDFARATNLPANQQYGILKVMTYTDADEANLIKTSVNPRAYQVTSTWAIGDSLPNPNDASEFTTTFTYDYDQVGTPDYGLLMQVDSPTVSTTISPDTLNDNQQITTTYTYTSDNQTQTLTDGEGVETTYVYGTSGSNKGYLTEVQVGTQAASSIDTAFAYNSVGQQISITDPKGNVYTTFINQLDQDIRSETPQVTSHGNVKYYTTSEYDLNGNIETFGVSNYDETGTAGTPSVIETDYVYNIMDRITSVTEPITSSTDRTTSFGYDNLFRQVESTLPEGNKGATDYDEVNRPIKIYSGFDGTNVLKSSAYITGELHYDKNSNVIKVVDGRSNDSHATFDAYDRTEEIQDRLASNANKTIYAYNRASQTTKVTCKGKQRSYNSGTSAYQWNNDVLLAEVETEYDNIGRAYLLRKLAEDSSGIDLGYSSHETATNFEDGYLSVRTKFFDNNNIELTEDDLGYETTYIYDDYNRLESKTDDRDGSGSNDNSDTFTYDDNSNLTKLTAKYFDESKNSFRTIETEYTYDSINRLITEKSPAVGGTNLYKNWRFDSRSNLVKMTDRKGVVHRYDFDLLNRMTRGEDKSIDLHKISGSGLVSTSTEDIGSITEYDRNSNVIKSIDSNGNTTEFLYDLAGRWLQTILPDGGAIVSGGHRRTAGSGHTVTLVGTGPFYSKTGAYDGNSNMLKLTDENGTVITNTYDANDLLTEQNANISGATTNGFDVVGDTRRLWNYDGLYRVCYAETGAIGFETTDDNFVYNTLGSSERETQGADWGGSTGWFRPTIIKSHDESGRVWRRDSLEAGTRAEYLFDRKHRPYEARLYDLDPSTMTATARAGLTNGKMAEYKYFGGGFTHAEQIHYHPFEEERDIKSTFERDDLLRLTKVRHTRNDGANRKLMGAFAYDYDEAGMMKYEARWYDDDSDGTSTTPDNVDFYFHDKQNQLYKAIYNAEGIDLSSLNWANINDNNVAHTDRVAYSRRRHPTREKANWYKAPVTPASEPDASHAPEQTTLYTTSDVAGKDEDDPVATGNGSRHNFTMIGQVAHEYDYNRNLTKDPLRHFKYNYLNELSEVYRVSDGEIVTSITYDAFGRQRKEDKYWEVGRRMYFDSRFELDTDIDADADSKDMKYIDGGITTTSYWPDDITDPEFEYTPTGVSYRMDLQTADWNTHLDFSTGGTQYFDYHVEVPYVSDPNYPFPLGMVTAHPTHALWIFPKEYRVANAADPTKNIWLSVSVPTGTHGQHAIGLALDGTSNYIYIDGSQVASFPTGGGGTLRPFATFGSCAYVTSFPPGSGDGYNQGLKLFDAIAYGKAFNRFDNSNGQPETMQDQSEGPMLRNRFSLLVQVPGPSEPEVIDAILVDSTTWDCTKDGETHTYILGVDGWRNTGLVISEGVRDPLQNGTQNGTDPAEGPPIHCDNTIGVHRRHHTDAVGQTIVYSMEYDTGCDLYEDEVGSAGFMFYSPGTALNETNNRLSIACASMFAYQHGGVDDDDIWKWNSQPMVYMAADGAPGTGSGTGNAPAEGGVCACRGDDPSMLGWSITKENSSIASVSDGNGNWADNQSGMVLGWDIFDDWVPPWHPDAVWITDDGACEAYERAAKNTYKKAEKEVKKAINAVGEVVEEAWDELSDIAKTATNTALEVLDGAVELAEATVEVVSENVGKAVNAISELDADDWMDFASMALDVVGAIPVVGEIADGANALLALGRGDEVGAFLSVAAMIPGVGSALVLPIKAALKAGKSIAKMMNKLIKAIKSGLAKISDCNSSNPAVKAIQELLEKIGKQFCFLEGTKVHTEDGLEDIEDIEPGDLVWSFNEATGTWELKVVQATHRSVHNGLIISIEVNGETIESTGGHPFWVTKGEDLKSRPLAAELGGYRGARDGRWVSASKLKAGDVLLSRWNEPLTVTSVTSRSTTTWVYNFSVQGSHTYGVGKQGVLAHNECHHMLPQQYKDKFEAAGLDIEEFTKELDFSKHRQKGSGVHSSSAREDGDNWNKDWGNFFEDNPNASKEAILGQLEKMKKKYDIDD